MNEVADAWREIAQEDRAQPGWHARRIFVRASCEVRAAIQTPDEVVAVLFEADNRSLPAGALLPDCVGFVLALETIMPGPSGRSRLCLALKDRSYWDVFETLAGDVAGVVAAAPDEPKAIRALLGRLNTWQRFAERFGIRPLSADEQAGLFAELLFLQEELLPVLAAADAVRAWRGPFMEPHDFRYGDVAVEIKATTARAPVSFQVASLEQLDVGSAVFVFVHHSILEIDSEDGLSLPDLVSRLREEIATSDAGAASEFDALLIEVGYLGIHSEAYRAKPFAVTRCRWFEVRDAFPRLTPSNVPAGITAARYSVSLGACAPFAVDAAAARERIRARWR